jgi:hypothetical protein
VGSFSGELCRDDFIVLRPLSFFGLFVSSAFFLLQPLSFSGLFASPAFLFLRPLSFSGLFVSSASFFLQPLSFSSPFAFPSSFFLRPLSFFLTKQAWSTEGTLGYIRFTPDTSRKDYHRMIKGPLVRVTTIIFCTEYLKPRSFLFTSCSAPSKAACRLIVIPE